MDNEERLPSFNKFCILGSLISLSSLLPLPLFFTLDELKLLMELRRNGSWVVDETDDDAE